MSRHGEWLLTLDVADDILRSPSGLRSPQCCQCCHLQLAPGLHWRGSESDWARVESGVAAWCEVTLHLAPQHRHCEARTTTHVADLPFTSRKKSSLRKQLFKTENIFKNICRPDSFNWTSLHTSQECIHAWALIDVFCNVVAKCHPF